MRAAMPTVPPKAAAPIQHVLHVLHVLNVLILLTALSPLAGFAQAGTHTPSRDAPGPFRGNVHWWRLDRSNQAPAELRISHTTSNSITFELQASAGANTGTLSGKAMLESAKPTRYRYRQASPGSTTVCTLTFDYVNHQIVIAQRGSAAACSAGNGVRYAGTYVAGDKNPNVKPDLLSLGVFKLKGDDTTFRKLVGADYAQFVATADVIDSSTDNVDTQPMTIVNMFVRGVACNTKSMIIFDGQGRQWAALWVAGATGPVTLHYYTNVDADKQTLPSVIAAHKAACPGDTVQVRMPS